MTPARWNRLKDIFAQAMEKEGAERDSFVAAACAEDAELLAQARRLVASHAGAGAGDFLSDPAITLTGEADPGNLFEAGQVVAGRFRIVRFIARGGMGEVYEAEDLTLATRVALKTIQPHITGERALELFKQEILSARRVTHPNVCRIYDIAEHVREDGGLPVTLLTMELLEGPTLSRYLQDHGPFSSREALRLIEQIGAGLQAAHDAGVIHGDFKSGNVILTDGPNGFRPVITDFGLARPAGSGPEKHPRGTPGYMAPEQLEGGLVTSAVDVYALGVVIGRMSGDARSGAWKRVMERCSHVDPAKRYQRPLDVARALRRHITVWRIGLAAAAGAALLAALLWRAEDARPVQPTAPVVANSGLPAPPPNTEIARPAPAQEVAKEPVEKRMVDRQVWDESVYSYGSVSADGRYLTYTDQSTGDLAIRDLRAGTNRLLTHKPGGWEGSTAYAEGSLISPDNRQVAYHWYERFVTNFPRRIKSELRVVSSGSETSPPRVLLPAEDSIMVALYAWSVDGKNLLAFRALLDRTFQLVWVSVEDGTVRVVKALKAQPRRANVSPDGRYIAYDESGIIYVRDVESGEETVVVPNPGGGQGPLWTPDGSRILFMSQRTGRGSLWAIPIEHGKPAGPEVLVRQPGVSALGITRSGALYHAAGLLQQNILVAEVDENMLAAKPSTAAATQFVNFNFAPAWSPDGESLIYRSLRGLDGLRALVVRPRIAGQDRPVPTQVQYVDTATVWFPDGLSVLAAGRRIPLAGEEGLYRVDVASGAAQLLMRGIPDYYELVREGQAVLYTTTDPETRQFSGQFNLLEIGSDKFTTVKRTGVNGRRFGSLAASPDGTQVAYVVDDNMTRESFLEVMPVDGGESREVFRAPSAGFPSNAGIAWSPDQRYLLFVRGISKQPDSMDVSIWRVPVSGGDAQSTGVTVQNAANPTVLAFPSVHPDGRHIAYTRRQPFTEVRVLENFLPK